MPHQEEQNCTLEHAFLSSNYHTNPDNPPCTKHICISFHVSCLFSLQNWYSRPPLGPGWALTLVTVSIYLGYNCWGHNWHYPIWHQPLKHTSPVPLPAFREGASRMAELRWAADSVNTPHSMHCCPRATSRHAHRMDYQEHYTFPHFLTLDAEKGLAGAEDKPFPLPLLCWIR